MKNNSVSFGARMLGTVNIKTKISNRWKDVPMSFVRLHPKYNQGDRLALSTITRLWEGKNLSGSILDQAVILDDPVYAITSQTSDFKNLEPKKILGMITTNQTKNSTDDTLEIFRVGVTPKYAYSQNKNSRDVKHIGTALVKKLVEILHRKTDIKRVVAVAEEPSEVNFLQKLNMKEKSSNFRYTNFELNKENFDEFVK